jgi:predicted enzyme related to lactoylglutathione lyase
VVPSVGAMNFVSVRIITEDVDRLVDFYARLTGATVDRPAPDFAEIRTPGGTIAVGSTRTVALFGAGTAEASANRSVIVELLVDDVDAAYASLQGWVGTFVNEPTTMPWGNRSLLLRDPDGNLVNLFTPVTPAAVEKFSRYAR